MAILKFFGSRSVCCYSISLMGIIGAKFSDINNMVALVT